MVPGHNALQVLTRSVKNGYILGLQPVYTVCNCSCQTHCVSMAALQEGEVAVNIRICSPCLAMAIDVASAVTSFHRHHVLVVQLAAVIALQ